MTGYMARGFLPGMAQLVNIMTNKGADTADKLAIINSIEIIDYDADGSALYYAFVANNPENREKLMKIGVVFQAIVDMTANDGGSIDISGFGFSHAGAQWFNPELGGWIDYVPGVGTGDRP